MRIEKITRSEKISDRYYLEFEDGTRIKADIAQIADYSLYTGRELTDDEYESLCEDAALTSAKKRSLRILGSRNMSRREMTTRLVQKGEDAETARETAEWLASIGAINDEEYARMIVRHYEAKGYGIARIKDELYKRGIERDMWEAALEEFSGTDDAAYSFLERKLRGDVADKDEIRRATNALYRRGFSWGDINSALTRYINDIEDADS